MGRHRVPARRRSVPARSRGDPRGDELPVERDPCPWCAELDPRTLERARAAAPGDRPAGVPGAGQHQRVTLDARADRQPPRDSRGPDGRRGDGFSALRGHRVHRGPAADAAALRALSGGGVQAGCRSVAGFQPAEPAGEPAVPAGGGVLRIRSSPDRVMSMSNRIDAARLLPIVMGVALGSALLAALALLLSGRTAGELVRKREQQAELVALSQNMPLQAGAAVRGSAPAFDSLAESRVRLTRVLADSGLAKGSAANAAGWTAMLEQSQSVLDGREAALKAQQAAAAVRELTPQLLTALANTVKALDPPQ